MFRLAKWVWASTPSLLSQPKPSNNQPIVTFPPENPAEAGSTAVITSAFIASDAIKIEPVEHDALGHLQAELTGLERLFEKKIGFWKNKEIELTTSLSSLPKSPPGKIRYFGIPKLVGQLMTELQTLVFSANWTLHQLLLTTQPQVISLGKELNEECNKLIALDNAKEVNKEARKLIKLNICRLSIGILEALKLLINDVQREILWCVQLEKLSEKMAISLTEFVITMLAHMPLPDFNFQMNGLYRKFLYHEIHYEKAKIDGFLVAAGGEVQKAQTVLKETDESFLNKTEQGFFSKVLAIEDKEVAETKQLTLAYK